MTSAQSNKSLDVVKRLYAAFARGDPEAALAEVAEEVHWNEAESFLYADQNPYQTKAAVAAGVFGRLGTEWKDWSAPPSEYLEAGEIVVVALGRTTGVNVATGKSVDAQFAHVWRLSEGKIVGFQQYTDTLQIWRAARID